MILKIPSALLVSMPLLKVLAVSALTTHSWSPHQLVRSVTMSQIKLFVPHALDSILIQISLSAIFAPMPPQLPTAHSVWITSSSTPNVWAASRESPIVVASAMDTFSTERPASVASLPLW
jgi:hypothetical protein